MSNPFAHARFLTSAARLGQAPADEGREVAFAGRSNAGKSSALNAICQQKALARTSRTPGRTQLLNFFAVTERTRLVDLPGYGYARVPVKVKQQWQREMTRYLNERHSLAGLVLVMDVRHPLTEFDREMIAWCQQAGLPLHILLTKADKLKRGAAQSALLGVKRALEEGGVDASLQLFSAHDRQGVEDARGLLAEWLALADPSVSDTRPDRGA